MADSDPTVPLRSAKEAHVWMVGAGIANLAAAVFLIRDAGVPGEQIHLLEALPLAGGSLDGGSSPVQPGYVTRGGRMLADEVYSCLWNLLESIPDRDDPSISVRAAIAAFARRVPTEAHARLINAKHEILDAAEYGLSRHDRLELVRLLGTSEHALSSRRIDEIFSEHFFTTNFWQMWRTTFAFQTWHSAVELKRYFVRFAQEFPRLDTLAGVRRTPYNLYDSIVVPLQRWLTEHEIDLRLGAVVTDVDFTDDGVHRRAGTLHYTAGGEAVAQQLGADDYLFVTLGSITADATYGGSRSVPELIRDRRDGSWRLWETIAEKAADFGRPSTFFGNLDENKWESFTLTTHGRALIDRIVKFSNNEPGTGALMTFVDSGWLMSIVVPYQPHFPGMADGTHTLWGYGLLGDRIGDYTPKKMSESTGEEILIELVHQLGFEDALEELLATTEVTTAMMPYASSVFSRRVAGDRPKVVPDRSANFAFLGQFTEIPEDVVFTVEYSVRGAMLAVYTLFGMDDEIPPIYHGLLDPKVGPHSLRAAFR